MSLISQKRASSLARVIACFPVKTASQVIRFCGSLVVISEGPQPYNAVVRRQIQGEFFSRVFAGISRIPGTSARVIV